MPKTCCLLCHMVLYYMNASNVLPCARSTYHSISIIINKLVARVESILHNVKPIKITLLKESQRFYHLKQLSRKKKSYVNESYNWQFCTLTLRILFPLWTSTVAVSNEADSILKNDGSVKRFRHAPAPATSNL